MAQLLADALALETMPVVAERMNSLPKVVFSRTLDKASWQNTKLVKTGMVEEVRRMKNVVLCYEPGP